MEPGDDEPWTTESDESWFPDAQSAPDLEVDWEPPELAGCIYFPDGTYIEVEQDKPPFGFGRWAYERGVSSMSLLDEARNLNGGPGATCSIFRFLAGLKPKERDEWEEVFSAPIDEIQHAAVAKLLKAHGHETSNNTVSRHRRGECQCH